MATFFLALFAPTVVTFALKFGPADYFSLMILAFTTVAAVLGASLLRGLASLFLGLTVGLVGIDMQTGQARLALDVPQLLDGIEVVILAVGLFAVGEALFVVSRKSLLADELIPIAGRIWMTKDEWRRSWKPWLRGSCIGFPFGALPAGGAEIPTFLSYSVERKLSKHPEEFGKGAIEGVAGPEATNNSAVTGVLVPLLTLGLPTSATAAILLVAFQQYGLHPGPLLFQSNPNLVWGLIASLYIGNVMLLVLNLPLAGNMGAAPGHSAALPLCRHSRFRQSWRVQPARLGVRSRHALRLRFSRLCDAVRRHPGLPGDPWPDSRAAGRAAVPARHGDQPGRPDGVSDPADLGDHPGGRARCSCRAVDLRDGQVAAEQGIVSCARKGIR